MFVCCVCEGGVVSVCCGGVVCEGVVCRGVCVCVVGVSVCCVCLCVCVLCVCVVCVCENYQGFFYTYQVSAFPAHSASF